MLQPVYFYLNTIWALQAILVGAIYTTTWFLSGTRFAGLLSALFYIFNKYAFKPPLSV